MYASSKMVFIVCLLTLFACGNTPDVTSLRTQRSTMTSSIVKDSFDIYITLPPNYENSKKAFPVIYYLDANLRSGVKLRSIIDEFQKKGQPIEALFVGVGHFGNYHATRRRDFITPFIKVGNDSLISDDQSYGQAERFYSFLQTELIPHVEKNYRTTQSRVLIGHSLGGLFTFYCLFKKQRLFSDFVALSPALWVNHENIYDFLTTYRRDSTHLHANLYLCVGGAEKFNFILSGAHKMKAYLEKNRFESLHFEYQEFPGETHNSEVPLVLNKLLPTLRLE